MEKEENRTAGGQDRVGTVEGLDYDIVSSTEQGPIRQVMQAILDYEAEHGKNIPSKDADKVGLPPEGIFAYSLDGKLLGGLTLRIYNDWVYLEHGFVWPEYRRQGIYAELIAIVERSAREQGLTGLDVWTYEWEAPDVYEALGFSANGCLHDFPRGDTTIHYIKDFLGRSTDIRRRNDPLTMEELREMDGEPAYLSFGPGCGEWVLVIWHEQKPMLRHKNGAPALISFALDMGGKLYRYPPKEDSLERVPM